jgi:hypothetical protein
VALATKRPLPPPERQPEPTAGMAASEYSALIAATIYAGLIANRRPETEAQRVEYMTVAVKDARTLIEAARKVAGA